MKKSNKLMMAMAIMVSITFATTQVGIARNPNASKFIVASDGKVKLVNDTDKKVNIHTGTGSVTLNPGGGSTSFSCTIGKSIKADGKEIFKVTEKMCGETIKLSSYL